MSLVVNTTIFDHRVGDPPIPTLASRVFTSPLTAHVGAQVLPKASEAGTVRLTRYDPANLMYFNRDAALNMIGSVVFINVDGVAMHQWPYQVRYFVADVKLISMEVVVSHYGYRNGTLHHWRPASKVVTEWTLYAIPFV